MSWNCQRLSPLRSACQIQQKSCDSLRDNRDTCRVRWLTRSGRTCYRAWLIFMSGRRPDSNAGYVRITGRLKDMIIRGGENLFPVEIENVLLEHPAVAEVAVVGIPDERWGETVACFIRPARGASLNRVALVDHCRSAFDPRRRRLAPCTIGENPEIRAA